LANDLWIGGIFLKSEGGYEIILKSLEHNKKRLRTIGNSPERKDAAAMFASVVKTEPEKKALCKNLIPYLDWYVQGI